MSNPSIAEYYFDYNIKKLPMGDGADENIAEPKIYFERDYRKRNLPYSMFVVPREWLGKGNVYAGAIVASRPEEEITKAHLPYDEVRVVFASGEMDGADMLSRSGAKSKNAPKCSFKSFYENGCNIVVSEGADDFSGMGVIEMLSGGKQVARFMFAVNFVMRKKISYVLVRDAGGVELKFECDACPVGLEVALVSNPARFPCLKSDANNNIECKLKLDFGKKGKTPRLQLPREKSYALRDRYLSAVLLGEETNKYYYLECRRNDFLEFDDPVPALATTIDRACPFCHGKINRAVINEKNRAYKEGGISCDGKSGVGRLSVYSGENGRSVAKNCLYCSGDIKINDDGNWSFTQKYGKILPPDFMNHQDFKIAFVGSTRAGKTTYISRFFNITDAQKQVVDEGAVRVNMDMRTAAQAVSVFGLDVNTAPIGLLETSGNSGYLRRENWYQQNVNYTQRRISLQPSYYPRATRTDECEKYPFIAEVNKKAYVSFYDMAGERAEQEMQVGKLITDGRPIGIFCIVNGESDAVGNSNVMHQLESAQLPANCPIAVIVTKMDMLESEFDPSCSCLRSDYFEPIKGGYIGSELERKINFSSEEIRSYLSEKRLLPNFTRYRNVRYFGVSSFNFAESIHEANENINDPGKIKFECSCKQIELPFVWMMKQFGLIK